MRSRAVFPVLIVIAAGAAGLFAWSGSVAAPSVGKKFTDKSAGAVAVDVELVLAVDISYSMDPEEQALQREGYLNAITSREFLNALKEGANGRIAITYFEWAGAYDQRIVLPWRLLDGPESAAGIANEISQVPYHRGSRTSIAGALAFGKPLFDNSGYRGLRRVIDVSGDGPNNNGPFVTPVRDDIVNSGITINGLPILLNRPNTAYNWGNIDHLDWYYEDCVIGGPGAFVIPIRDREKFKEATRTKLILEVAGRVPKERVIPVQAQTKTPRVSCTVGEQQWQERWGGPFR